MDRLSASREIPRPDPRVHKSIESSTEASISTCWTCSSCDTECPANIAAGRLRPQAMVRLASLGFLDELAKKHEIWYCIRCRRCSEICPNRVKPATVIEFARKQSLADGWTDGEAVKRYGDLYTRFQRVRWRTVEMCMEGEFDGLSESRWTEWLETPVPEFEGKLRFDSDQSVPATAGREKVSACFTCGECSSVCPISCGRAVFDPRTIVRMALLGMTRFLMETPFIWLCIGCKRCSEACSQLIDGCRTVEELREMAIRKEIVDRGFRERLRRAERVIMARFVAEVDRIFGFRETSSM